MQMIPIGQMAGQFNISTRTLRYYEQIGLLQSRGKTEGGYRLYSEQDARRLQQILLLRRLRIPLKDIGELLKQPEARRAIQIFEENILALDSEINDLALVRGSLNALLERLRVNGKALPLPRLLDLELAGLLLLPGIPPEKKEAKQMKSKTEVQPYRDGDVRIVYLPPATVAAVHALGGEPEEETRRAVEKLVRETDLFAHKPDARHYGFNHPNGTKPDGSDHGYERWLTIPPDWTPPPPFTKKQFPGGLYAARTIPFGAFDEWGKLHMWVQNNPDLALNLGPEERMNGLLEEELDYIHLYQLPAQRQIKNLQLDLLLPVTKTTDD